MDYKIKLSVKDKVNITLNLPGNGTRNQIKTIISIKNKLKLTDEEGATVVLNRQDSGISVDYLDLSVRDKATECVFTKEEISYLKEIVSILDNQGRFSESNIESLEKILDLPI